MSPQDQQIVVAEYCGWTTKYIFGNGMDCDVFIDPVGLVQEHYPHYLNDLNAMRDAEMRLSDISPGKDEKGNSIPSDRARYRLELCIVTATRGGPIHATAAQKVEAFLRTVGKWKE